MGYAGVRVLGYGSFSVVCEFDEGIYKLIDHPDPAYAWFVEYCKGKDSRYLPKIKGPLCFGEFTVYKLEKMVSIEYLDLEEDYTRLNKMIAFEYTRETTGCKELDGILKDLKSSQYGYDIGSENIMKRGDDLVLTDPLC